MVKGRTIEMGSWTCVCLGAFNGATSCCDGNEKSKKKKTIEESVVVGWSFVSSTVDDFQGLCAELYGMEEGMNYLYNGGMRCALVDEGNIEAKEIGDFKREGVVEWW